MPEWIEPVIYGFMGGFAGAFLAGQLTRMRARMRGEWLKRGGEPHVPCPDAPGYSCVSLDCWQKGCEAERRRAWSQGPGKVVLDEAAAKDGCVGPATEDYMDVRVELENPANWTRDERTCGCVFWEFQHPLTDEGTDVKPWEAVKHG